MIPWNPWGIRGIRKSAGESVNPPITESACPYPGFPGEGAWRSLSFAFASLFERCRSGLRQTDRGAPFLGAVWCRECYGALSFCALRGHIGALDDDVKGEVAMQRVHEVVVAQRARVSRCDAS